MNLAYLDIDYHLSNFARLNKTSESFRTMLLLSWLYHDHALEGVVLNLDTIERALSQKPTRNFCDTRVKKSLCRLRQLAVSLLNQEIDDQFSLEFARSLHRHLSDEGSEAAGRYRKRDTTPGVYNLDCVPHNNLSYYVRRCFDLYEENWKTMHPIRAAAFAHHEFMKVFPFDEKTGIVGRMMMNQMLLSAGYPPAIIHAKDRHLYFAALDGHPKRLANLIGDAIKETLQAADEFALEEAPLQSIAL